MHLDKFHDEIRLLERWDFEDSFRIASRNRVIKINFLN